MPDSAVESSSTSVADHSLAPSNVGFGDTITPDWYVQSSPKVGLQLEGSEHRRRYGLRILPCIVLLRHSLFIIDMLIVTRFGESNYEVFDPLNWMLDGHVELPYSLPNMDMDAQAMI